VLRLIKLGAPAENAAAEALKNLILQSWPDVDTNPHCDIRIITGVYLTGQKIEDLDIVLLAVFQQPREIPLLDSAGAVVASYLLGSLCCVIEVKSHRCESAEIRAGALWVTYNGEEKNVTKQNRDQMHSLAEFLTAAGAGRAHVTRFIWLENVTASELRQRSINSELPHEIILKDSTWEDVLFSIWRGWRGRHPEALGFADNLYFISADINRNTPADLNLISKILTKEEMLMRPFSYADLPERQNVPQPDYQPTWFTHRQLPRPHSAFTMGHVLAVFGMVVALGVAVAVYTPRLMLWTEQQRELSAKGSGKLAQYAGSYRCQANSEIYSITLADQGQRLQMTSTNGSSELVPAAADEFKTSGFTSRFSGRVRFNRTPQGQVGSMVMLPVGGTKVICPRVE
jgi:hypothetical protein